MPLNDILSSMEKVRIVQELVPGKQITIAHIIANPDPQLYGVIGMKPKPDYSKSAIGIVTVCPAETAIIAGDIATKSAGVRLDFVNLQTGTLIVAGSVSETESALKAVVSYARDKLGFDVCEITRT